MTFSKLFQSNIIENVWYNNDVHNIKHININNNNNNNDNNDNNNKIGCTNDKSCYNSFSAVKRTLIIVIIYLIIVFFHSMILAIGESKRQCAESPPLFDTIHEIRENTENHIIQFLSSIDPDHVTMAITLLFATILWFHPQRGLVFRRSLVFHAFLSIMRATLIYVTTIPSPNYLCRQRYVEPGYRRVILRATSLNFPFLRPFFPSLPTGITCCDIIVSGHTCVLMVDTLSIHTTVKNRWIKFMVWFLACIAAFGYMEKERHYTVDVLIAMYIGISSVAIYTLCVKHYKNNWLIRFLEQPAVYKNGVDGIDLIQCFIERTRSLKQNVPPVLQ